MSRSISQEHIDAYLKGDLKVLFNAVKEDPELSFEIRIGNEVSIYYHKDKILTTKMYSNGEVKVFMLSDKYYNEPHRLKPSVDLSDKENLRSLVRIRKYFKEAKRLVYSYKPGVEFSIQQNIALGNTSFDGKYLVVDMEWQFSQKDLPASVRIPRTRIDLVLISTKPNKDGLYDIYLAELKVGMGAVEGESGTIAHVKKTQNIVLLKEACESLREDVITIIQQKEKLGLVSGSHGEIRLAEKPKMMLILAYRGAAEREALEKEYNKACKAADALGMEKPVKVMHNALISL